MDVQRWEYKVVYYDPRGRVSVEGHETIIQEGERMTAFGRRYLNSLGDQGWELVGIHHQRFGAGFHIFKRPLAPDQQAEPPAPLEQAQPTPTSSTGQSSQVISA